MNTFKLFTNNICQLKIIVRTSTKSHYDILRVSSNSTQDDIKSAYYELSKQYHPDKNKSVEAKEVFQRIIDAYETLGNYNKRAEYDRKLNIKGDWIILTHNDKGKRDAMKNYRTDKFHDHQFTSIQRKGVYNYDQWVKAHYGKLFHTTYARRQRAAAARRQLDESNDDDFVPVYYSIILCIFLYILQEYLIKPNYDKDLIKHKRASKP